jgi:hypothetical protein
MRLAHLAFATFALLGACTEYDLNRDKPVEQEGEGDTAVTEPGDGGAADTDSGEPAGDTGHTKVPPGGSTEALYAHSASVLYSVEPVAPYTVTAIGSFSGGGGGVEITDLAIDGDGRMIAIGFKDVYEVDPTNAQLTRLSSHSSETNALSFLSNGRLIAGGSDRVYEVDTTTGELGPAGDLGGWFFSGDMVGLPDGLLYCAGSRSSSGGQTSLVVWDPVADAVISEASTGVGSLYGVGWAEETLFGFSSDGDIVTIDQTSGRATVVASPGIVFYGAATNPWAW